MSTTVTGTTGVTATAATSATSSSTASEASDRFLKLLVTQMQNQDPLNPMDNAQVTSQMAQINTVTGIDKLNTTMGALSGNMNQMQMLQSAGLVGHSVRLEGNMLNMGADGKGYGAYDLGGAASNVQIDVFNAAGVKVDSFNKTGMPAGQNEFNWSPPEGTSTTGLTFKITATSGGKAITSTPLMYDQVDAVSTTNGVLNLELHNAGNTAYGKVKAVS
jgi:flagellar basal-body rod modification protein FlgD